MFEPFKSESSSGFNNIQLITKLFRNILSGYNNIKLKIHEKNNRLEIIIYSDNKQHVEDLKKHLEDHNLKVKPTKFDTSNLKNDLWKDKTVIVIHEVEIDELKKIVPLSVYHFKNLPICQKEILNLEANEIPNEVKNFIKENKAYLHDTKMLVLSRFIKASNPKDLQTKYLQGEEALIMTYGVENGLYQMIIEHFKEKVQGIKEKLYSVWYEPEQIGTPLYQSMKAFIVKANPPSDTIFLKIPSEFCVRKKVAEIAKTIPLRTIEYLANDDEIIQKLNLITKKLTNETWQGVVGGYGRIRYILHSLDKELLIALTQAFDQRGIAAEYDKNLNNIIISNPNNEVIQKLKALRWPDRQKKIIAEGESSTQNLSEELQKLLHLSLNQNVAKISHNDLLELLNNINGSIMLELLKLNDQYFNINRKNLNVSLISLDIRAAIINGMWNAIFTEDSNIIQRVKLIGQFNKDFAKEIFNKLIAHDESPTLGDNLFLQIKDIKKGENEIKTVTETLINSKISELRPNFAATNR